MTYAPAQACGLSKQQVFDFAERAYEALELTPGMDLGPIIDALGGQVRWVSSQDINATLDGSIVVHPGGKKFEIFVAQDGGPQRARFTIAHELGHYLLHSGSATAGMTAERYGTGRVEWEANWFAAGFLMPKKAFVDAAHRHAGYLANMASEFKVSLAAAEIRAKDLGLNVW